MVLGGVIKLNRRGYTLIGLVVVILFYFQFFKKTSRPNDIKIDLLSLLQTAIQAAEAGGEAIISVKNDYKVESKGKTQEGMEDSVTTADFLSHCIMEHIITSKFPNVKFISEEKDTTCEANKEYTHLETNIEIQNEFVRTGDVTIWIDPLDATHEYTEKLYQYVTTMVCVAVNGQPIIGVIHNPYDKNTSWAVVGHGYSNNLKELKNESHKGSKVIISRSHSGSIKEVLKKSFTDFEVEIAAGAGYKVLQVAKNEVDAYLHITAIKKWDICAGNAILNALGGKMTTKYGKTLTYYNDTDVVNKDGLIATFKNNELFVDKLSHSI